MKKGILLLQMGGPNSMDDIEPFLFNLFRDKYIIQLPSFMQPFQQGFARIISRSRAPKVAAQYAEMGGKSPIGFETEAQAKALEKYLNKTKDLKLAAGKPDFKVFYAMRYSTPFLKDTFKAIEREGLDDLTVIPLYPHYSIATSGSSIIECKELFDETDFAKKVKINYVEGFHDNEYFLRLIHERIKTRLDDFASEGLKDPNKIWILFSAHGLPQKYVTNGDPYEEQVKDSVRKIMGRFPMYKHSISYQSRVGPVKWLPPATDDEIKRLAKEMNVKNLLVVPISFVGDHIETIQEIGVEYKELAHEKGIENFKITRLPKANSLLIKTLASISENN